MAYIENREIQNPDSKKRKIKTQTHEKSTKEQRNQNQHRPMRINQRIEKPKLTHTHEESTQRTEKSKPRPYLKKKTQAHHKST